MSYISEYIAKIESGEAIVGKKIRQLYLGMLKPIVDGQSEEWYFDEKAGNAFIEFCESFCKQSKGEWAGKPLELALFQKAKYNALFGIKSRVTKLRRFTEVFDVRARKNGKSTENAALGLYMEMIEPGANVYVAATKFAQARLVWEEATKMVDKSPELAHYFRHKVFPIPVLLFRDSQFQALSKQTNTQDGLNVSCGIIDEVHELPQSVYDILVQGTSTRRQPLISMITTAGFVRGGLFDNKYDYCTRVLNGTWDDPSILPIIYEQDSEEEILDERMWVKANPGLGIMKQWDYLRKMVRLAKGDTTVRGTVLTKDFNFIGVRSESCWDAATITVDEIYDDKQLKALRDRNWHAIGGCDLSRTNDLTAFTTMLFDNERSVFVVQTMYWVTDDFLESSAAQASHVPWDAWIERKLIRKSTSISPGDRKSHAINPMDVANYIEEMRKKLDITYVKIHYDAWSSPMLIDELERRGYMRDTTLIPTRQGFKTFSIPMQKLEQLLKEKRIVYQKNPVTRWMLSNVEKITDVNGNVMPQKLGNKTENKIDGASTIMDCLVGYCDKPAAYMVEK